MDWQDEYFEEKMEKSQRIEEAFELVVSNLSKQEVWELAQELISYAESSMNLGLLGEG